MLDVAQILARSLVRDEPAYRALTAPVEPSPAVEAAEEPALAAPEPTGGSPSAPEVG